MIQTTEEPKCHVAHDWFVLGVEDNGETVARCNRCKALRYTAEDQSVRYEVPEVAD